MDSTREMGTLIDSRKVRERLARYFTYFMYVLFEENDNGRI